MKPKVLKNDLEYEMALKHVESIMEQPESAIFNDEIELFTTLISIYEEENFPIDLPDPIDAILFAMDQQGLSRKDLVPIIGSQSKVSEILNRKRQLSLSMIRRLHEELNIPAAILLQDTQQQQIPAKQFNYDDYPVSEMVSLRYFPKYQKISQVKIYFEEAMSELFSQFGNSLPQPVYCKQTKHKTKTNVKALLAWQAHILQNIAQETLDSFSLETLDTAFIEELLTFSLYSKGPLLVKDYLQSYGIHFVIEQHLSKTYVDGASFKAHDDKPVIVLSLRHDRVDNFWFTLLHELAHVIKHLYDGTDNRAFFDDTSFHSEACDSKLEQEANLFAMEHLIPSSMIEKSDLSYVSLWTPSKIIETSKVLRRSPAILAGRIRYESGNYAVFSELLGAKGLKCLFQHGT